jgi:hypothetical protein
MGLYLGAIWVSCYFQKKKDMGQLSASDGRGRGIGHRWFEYFGHLRAANCTPTMTAAFFGKEKDSDHHHVKVNGPSTSRSALGNFLHLFFFLGI